MEDNICKNWDVIITIISSLIGIWTIWYFLMLPKLKYTLEILPFVNPTDVEANIKSRLKILYDNKDVHRLSIAKITIYNKGKGIAEIFSQPIKILFNTKILAVYPNDDLYTLGIIERDGITKNENFIEFLPKYINPNEKIDFNIVLETPDKLDIKVTGRCKGCSDIQEIKSKKYLIYIVYFAFGALSAYLVTYLTERFAKVTSQLGNKITILEQEIKEVESTVAKKNKDVLLCKEAEKICSLCKYGITLAIANNISLSEMEKIDLISKIDKFDNDMEMVNIKNGSTQLPK